MIQTLEPLVGLHGLFIGYLTVTGVCSLRLFVLMFVFPPTADGVIQGTVRNAIAIVFSAYVAMGQPIAFIEALHGLFLAEVMLREAAIGLVLGYAASTVFWVAESVGVYIDDLTGHNNIQITNPASQEQSTPVGTLLQQVAIMAFWALGGMTFLLGTLYESYGWWPVAKGAPIAGDIVESFVLRQTDTLMQSIAKLAAPLLFILVLVDIAFGFVSKSASKLDISSLSQPVKAAVAIAMLAIFIGLFVDQVHGQLALNSLEAQWNGIFSKHGKADNH
ncbi:type III secretion system export apparatus subunit SctT [Burkholderia sp. Ac-20344]|uniref:type III secretion system export apparatus subunit SctT n=1 Tax=Burkholderia sp. Ac-20344 TaxID=2703890 RepID=UPI00197C76E1|nr:type III secretion system export apparatus subunit SctT [Burkholderia sp. Ac-20344]MBN3834749.1 EscT/YscT/HrcT family type III secretion system export apparatus protein [Burkholderia sp. Ac-20344]